jgi:tetratricopeptide (TPR) repeat protein
MKLQLLKSHKFIICISILIVGTTISASSDKKYYQLGTNAQAEQNYEEAVKHFKKSLAEEEESPECLANLGLSYRFISEKYLNEAFKSYKKALKINPKHEETLGYLGEFYIMQGNIIKANEVLNKLNKMESSEAETLSEKLNKIIGQISKIKKKK